ncbi:MAG TPA: cysteine hydrolase family protein [Gaiellaceae bacterium]|nr:cysteine hydrolase family protein [Gaiellaceae bacterium]
MPGRCALLVVDVQRGFDEPRLGRRNNPECERTIGALIEAWRDRGRPLVFVRHDSAEPGSPLRPGTPGNAFKDVVSGEPDLLVTKRVNSAFLGDPDLAAWLRGRGIDAVAICGITTNHCCETTARMAGNLGFDTYFVADATHTFDRPARDGSVIPAEDVQRMTEANLEGEFARVVTAAELLALLPA